MSRLSPLLASAVLILGLAATGSAHAASSISSTAVVNPDLVVDKTAGIHFEGFFDPAEYEASSLQAVQWQVNPSGLACAPSAKLNEERSVKSDSDSVSHAGAVQADFSWQPTTPGAFTFCSYIGSFYSQYTFAVGSFPVQVRNPITTLTTSLPSAQFKEAGPIPLTIAATSEVARVVSVERNATGISCGPSAVVNQGYYVAGALEILGNQAPVVEDIQSGDKGSWHLCSYLGRTTDDATPLQVFDGPAYTVGPVRKVCSLNTRTVQKRTRWTINCPGLNGKVTLRAKQGGKTRSLTRTLKNGKVTIKASQLKLRRRAKVTVAVLRDGNKIVTRTVKVR